MEIKTLLIDDEYLALNLLEGYLKRVNGYEIVAKLESPIEALQILNSQQVDLLFLDIQMPEISGPNMLKTLSNPPVTIFTTAYDNYAIEAYNLNVVDYLCKPFSFNRFVQALNKASTILNPPHSVHNAAAPAKENTDFLSFKTEGKWIKIKYGDILYIQGLREYVKIFTTKGNHTVLQTLKTLVEELPEERFMRVHKSYIAAIDRIASLEGNMLVVNGEKIPVSRERKKEILSKVF